MTDDRHTTDEPREADGLRAATVEAASAFVDAWPDHGLDYSPASLARLDDLVDDEWADSHFADATLVHDGDPASAADARYTELVTRLGAYYGEVLLRAYGGTWTDSERHGRTVVEMTEGDVTLQSNVFHVAQECLADPSKFALSHDVVLGELGVDAPRVVADDATRRDAGMKREAPPDGTVVDAEGGEQSTGAAGEGGPHDPESIEAGFRADAADLVEEWPRYRLDFSPNSLVRLDTLVAEELRHPGLEGARLGGEDEASQFLTATAVEVGGYFGEVFVRHCGAEWEMAAGPMLVVAGTESEARLSPVGIAADCLKGEDSFTATYEALRSRLALDVDGVDDDAAMAAITRPTTAFVVEADDAEALASAADQFAEAWPTYDLDCSPDSLVRLDTLVADTEPESLPVVGVGAYLGQVLVEHYGAEWDELAEGGWVLALPDHADGPAMFVLPPVLRDCLDGDGSFGAAHDAALEQTGIAGPTVAGEE